MRFVYPTEISTPNEDNIKHLKGASNMTGFYPIGRMNTWHGGIHIEGDKKIKALADGNVIAYRVPKDYFHETIDNKISRYSNGFVLIQHNYESPKGQKMTFYSLYNHLASFKEMNEEKKIPDLLKKIAYKVKINASDTNEVKGVKITSSSNNGSLLAIAAKGTKLSFQGTEISNNKRKVKYITPKGKEITGYTYIEKYQGKQLVDKETGKVLEDTFKGSDGDYGANLYEEPKKSAEVIQLIPPGTVVEIATEDQAAKGWRKITKVGDKKVEGYCISGNIIGEDTLILTEKDCDSVENCCIPIQAGSVIGFTGLNGFEKQNEYRGAHIEVFTPDEVSDFLDNKLNDGENNKSFAKLTEGTELKKKLPFKIIKNTPVKKTGNTKEGYTEVEVDDLKLVITDRNKYLPTAFSNKVYTFSSEKDKSINEERLTSFNTIVDNIAKMGDTVRLDVDPPVGEIRRVTYINLNKGMVFWAKNEDIEEKTLTFTILPANTATQSQANNTQSQPAPTSTTGGSLNNTQNSAATDSAKVAVNIEETPVTAPQAQVVQQTQQNQAATATTEKVTYFKINKNLDEIDIICPEEENIQTKFATDTIVNYKEGKELKDKDKNKWYLIEATGFEKNGVSVRYKGLIKESGLGETFPAYDWKKFGFDVKEDADNKYIYDVKEKSRHPFLNEICKIVDEDGNGILEPGELQRAFNNHYKYDKLSHVVAKHISEWAYSGQYLSTLIDEVTQVLDKGIEQEEDAKIKKELETLKKERLDAFEAKVKQLAIWEAIEVKKSSYTTKLVNGVLMSSPVMVGSYLTYKLGEWVFKKFVFDDEPEKQIPLSPFPIKQPVVYHFHPIAFVEQMKRMNIITIEEARIRALLRAFRVGEGTVGEKGYSTIVGGSTFADHGKDFSTHPGVSVYIKNLGVNSDAAGAYQIMGYTYKWLNGYYKNEKTNKIDIYIPDKDWLKIYNITDFSPKSQDEMGVVLLKHKRNAAWPLILNGEIEKAIYEELSKEWASLPPGRYGQPAKTMEEELALYEKYLKEELQGITDLHLKNGFLERFK